MSDKLSSNPPSTPSNIPLFSPSTRVLSPSTPWTVSTHYFASYAKRRSEPTPTLRTVSEPIVRKNDDLGNLVVVVNRYVPRVRGADVARDGRKLIDEGVTLVLAHCIAGHKEMWEPMITHLLNLDNSNDDTKPRGIISEIWAIEPVHHGDSAWVNKDSGMEVDPMHYPVDFVEFVDRRLPLATDYDASTPLPAHLPRHSVLTRPNVVALGHSIGGSAIVHAALHSASSFAALILVEPLLANPATNVHRPYEIVSAAAAGRRDVFDSREQIIKLFKKHPAYKTWNDESIALFAQFGVYEDAQGKLRLKTKKEHEAVLSGNRYIPEGLWYATHSLSASLPVFFIYGTQSRLLPSWSKALTRKQPPNASSCDIDAGHMIVQEKPILLASVMFEYLIQHHKTSSTIKRQKQVSTKL